MKWHLLPAYFAFLVFCEVEEKPQVQSHLDLQNDQCSRIPNIFEVVRTNHFSQRTSSEYQESRDMTGERSLLVSLWWAVQQQPPNADALATACEAAALGVDVNVSIDKENLGTSDEAYNTPLLQAVKHEDIAMVELLLRSGADVTKASEDETPLTGAIETGNTNILELLLSAELSITELARHGNQTTEQIRRRRANSIRSHHTDLLSLATKKGDEKAMALLLKAGANTDGCCGEHYTPLQVAIGESRASSVKLLLEAGAQMSAESEGPTPSDWSVAIMLAILCTDKPDDPRAATCQQRRAVLDVILDHHKNQASDGQDRPHLNIPEHEAQTILSLLRRDSPGKLEGYAGHPKSIRQSLKEVGFSVDSTDAQASDSGGSERLADELYTESDPQIFLDTLLDNGFDINHPDRDGLTPSMLAVSKYGSLKLFRDLLARGADIEVRDTKGLPILTRIFTSWKSSAVATEMLQVLLQHDREKNRGVMSQNLRKQMETKAAVFGPSKTALWHAIGTMNVAAAAILIHEGADVHGVDHLGAGILFHLVTMPALVPSVLEKGVNIDQRETKNGMTPLLWATSFQGGTLIIHTLLENGAEIDATDRLGRTALLIAVRDGALATTRLLLEKGASLEKTFKADPGLLEYCRRPQRRRPQEFRKVIEALMEYGAEKWDVEGVVSYWKD